MVVLTAETCWAMIEYWINNKISGIKLVFLFPQLKTNFRHDSSPSFYFILFYFIFPWTEVKWLNKEGSKIDYFDHWSVVIPKHISELGNLGSVDGRSELFTAGLMSTHDVRFALLVFDGKHVMSSAGKFHWLDVRELLLFLVCSQSNGGVVITNNPWSVS